VIRRFVEKATTALDVDPTTVGDAVLAVDEAASNIILHGYQGQPGIIEIEVERTGDDLVVRLRDEAAPFDPTSFPAPDLTLPLEQQAVDGLGIHLIRRVMDKVTHRITPQGGNELLLVKRLEDKSEDFDIGN
jgi:serine/threonine-protein kinase RsbW